MDLLEFTPYLDEAGSPVAPQELSDLLYTTSEDTEARTTRQAQGESSRSSRYIVDDEEEDADDEEREGSSDEHSESGTHAPPSTQPEATATSALGGAVDTAPTAPAPGGVASAEPTTPARGGAARAEPTTLDQPAPEATSAAAPDAPTA